MTFPWGGIRKEESNQFITSAFLLVVDDLGMMMFPPRWWWWSQGEEKLYDLGSRLCIILLFLNHCQVGHYVSKHVPIQGYKMHCTPLKQKMRPAA